MKDFSYLSSGDLKCGLFLEVLGHDRCDGSQIHREECDSKENPENRENACPTTGRCPISVSNDNESTRIFHLL